MFFNSIFLLVSVIMVCAYVFARTLKNKVWVLACIAISGIVQAVYAYLQCFSLADSNHTIFKITGFMGNPGQLGGFQAIALVSMFTLYRKRWSLPIKILCAASALLIFGSLIIADSRAAMTAVVAGGAVLSYRYWKKILGQHKWLWGIVICVVCATAFLIYHYRPDSAASRLLIWRVCADMFADKPLLGFGTGGFNMNYMLYLEKFLTKHPEHILSSYADYAAYPYNEFIHILVEYGIIGFLLFGALIFVSVRRTTDKRLAAPLATLLTFALFSYPSYKLGLATLFSLLLGILSPPVTSRSKNIAVLILSSVAAITCTVGLYLNQNKFRTAIKETYAGRNTPADIEFIDRYFRENYKVLNINATYATFIRHYSSAFSEQNTRFLFPSSDNWCTIGLHFLENGDITTARKYFRQASQMEPKLVEPKYLLWRTFVLLGREEDAAHVAEDIFKMNAKVENTYTLRIKSEIHKYYSKTETE